MSVIYAVFVICGIPLNNNFIAAVLTILGYSINATIVVYDRVRENKRLMGKVMVAELVNTSVNQSLTRSINTTVATVLALLAACIMALIFNVDSILTFAFPLIVGMVSGVYSSLCISSSLWVVWQEHKAKKHSYVGKSKKSDGKAASKTKRLLIFQIVRWNMEFGLSTARMYPEILEQVIECYGKLGISQLEIFSIPFPSFQKEYVRELKKRVDFYGMTVCSVHPLLRLGTVDAVFGV